MINAINKAFAEPKAKSSDSVIFKVRILVALLIKNSVGFILPSFLLWKDDHGAEGIGKNCAAILQELPKDDHGAEGIGKNCAAILQELPKDDHGAKGMWKNCAAILQELPKEDPLVALLGCGDIYGKVYKET